ncbi:MAG: hypothetical protein ACHQJ5_09825 [Vicinamibacteria bacterium]
MAIRGAGARQCPDTGLAVPECSCKRCLELMLREFSPELMAGEIKITRRDPDPSSESGEHREAA